MFFPRHKRQAAIDQSAQRNVLNIETLEDRMMLSTVSVFAAGAAGDEAFDLKVNDVIVSTFENVGGDPSTGEFVQFDYHTDEKLTADDIRVEFFNDVFDEETGLNRDLFVDKIVVDGVTYETEDPSVFSTGIFRDGEVTGPGFFETEKLNINGSFFYSNDGASEGGGGGGGGINTEQTRIRVDASGHAGGEIIAVEILGREVQRFELTQSTEIYTVVLDEDVSVTDIGIRFVNDLYDEEKGIDRNATINNVQTIDLESGEREVVRLATNQFVYSTGTWTAEDGVVTGFRRGDTLHTDGVFRFGRPDNAPSDNNGGGDNGGGDTGGEIVRLQLNEEVFDSENAGLPVEDFEDYARAPIPDFYNQNIKAPLDSSTDNRIFRAGKILDGVTFQADADSEYRLNSRNETIVQFPSAVLGTPGAAPFTIDFDPGVRSVGFDLYPVDSDSLYQEFQNGEVVTSNTNARVEVFGASGLIGEYFVAAPQPDGFHAVPIFVGLESQEDITGVVISQHFTEGPQGLGKGATMFVDNVRFG